MNRDQNMSKIDIIIYKITWVSDTAHIHKRNYYNSSLIYIKYFQGLSFSRFQNFPQKGFWKIANIIQI